MIILFIYLPISTTIMSAISANVEILPIWRTIWDDINVDTGLLPITAVKYNLESMNNKLYEIIDGRPKLRRILLKNKIIGSHKDLSSIQTHCGIVDADLQVTHVIKQIFMLHTQTTLSTLDKVFVNAYYRRLLRAKLEQDYLQKTIRDDLVIVGVKEVDKCLLYALRLLRVICRYLDMTSTITPSSFNVSKLDKTRFWFLVSEKLLQLFGENHIQLLGQPGDDTLHSYPKDAIARITVQNNLRSKIFSMLNTTFNIWSGSILTIKDDIITVVPATYITRMVTKLS